MYQTPLFADDFKILNSTVQQSQWESVTRPAWGNFPVRICM